MKSIFTSLQLGKCSNDLFQRPLQQMQSWLKHFAFIFSLFFVSADMLGQGTGSTVAGFEVDASFKSGQIPSFWKTTAPNQTYFGGVGDDWSQGPSGNAVLKQVGGVSVPGLTANRTAIWQIDGNWGTNVPPDMSVFAGSSNKNGDLIGADQSPYAISTGSGGPQKNDITNVMLHTRTVSGNLWLFFAAETRSINGSSYLDFEYNQAGVTTSGGSMIGQGLVGGRTVNDILLVVNYTQGGKTPIVGVRTWLANGTWSAEVALGSGNSFMTTNTLAVDAVAPNASYAGDGTPANTSLAFQVVEGGLNISSLNLGGLNQCAPNATVTVKTRSSASYTSELKDWDILHFPLTPTSMSAVADIAPQCRALNGINIFTVTGTYADGTPTWSATGGTISNPTYVNGVATATLTINAPTSSATATLTVASPNVNCTSAVASKTAVINPNPVVNADATPAGNVSLNSAPPHYALSATVDGILSNNGFNYSWVQDPPQQVAGLLNGSGFLSATNVAGPTFTANPLGAGAYTWTVTATDKVTGCFSSDPVTRTLTSGFNCPSVARDPVCSGTTNSYTASVDIGEFETWKWTVNNGASINGADNEKSVSVTAGTASFTLTLTVTFDNPAVAARECPFSVIVNPLAAPPNVTYIPPTCTESTFSVQITNPEVGSTYKLTQLDGNIVNAGPYVSGVLIIGNLHIGQGYSIESTTSAGCKSNPNECGDFGDNLVARRSTKTGLTDEVRIQMLAAPPKVSTSPNPFVDRVRFSVITEVSGKGSLELYNMLGQKVHTVYQGHFDNATMRTFEYNVPLSQRTNLVYILRIGNKKTSGQLIGMK